LENPAQTLPNPPIPNPLHSRHHGRRRRGDPAPGPTTLPRVHVRAVTLLPLPLLPREPLPRASDPAAPRVGLPSGPPSSAPRRHPPRSRPRPAYHRMRRWRGRCSAHSTACSSSLPSPRHPRAPTPLVASSSSGGPFILGFASTELLDIVLVRYLVTTPRMLLMCRMRCYRACSKCWMICWTR
jgi:hypothetical protein